MKRIIFALMGLFLAGLGVYGYIENPIIQINFSFLHIAYHLIAGLAALWLAYKNQKIETASKILGTFFIPLIFESYIGHHNVFETHAIGHLVDALVFLAIGFIPGLNKNKSTLQAGL